MKKTVLLFALLIYSIPLLLIAAMSDSKAATEARKIWGDASRIGQARTWGDALWTKQIGFSSPGCKDEFTIVGSGVNTWDAAFIALPPNKGIIGIYQGVQFLHAVTPGAPLDPGTHTPIPGALTASTIQFLIDNKPVGPETPLVYNSDRTSWQVDVSWDSATVTDGLHILCAALFHSDGAQARTTATMISVKQP